MKAQVLSAFGDVGNFRLVDLPDPKAGPGQLVVRQLSSSVNPADTKIRKTEGPLSPALPASLGMDVAGVVVEVGDGVHGSAVGDRVYGCAGGVRGLPGAYAEAIAVDARLVAKAPGSIPLEDAGALPLVTITAWEGLVDRARVKPGDRVLVQGGTGGVGHVAIQVAKAHGAHVTATVSSAEKAAIARALGADVVLDYTKDAIPTGFDIVFDTTGKDNYAASFAAARDNGQVIVIVARHTVDLSPMHAKGLTLHVVFMLLPMLTGIGRERHGEILREAAALADAGRLKPLIGARFPLAELGAAHAALEEGRVTGKVVVTIGRS